MHTQPTGRSGSTVLVYPDSRTGDISQSPESSTLSGNLSGDDILIEIYFGLL